MPQPALATPLSPNLNDLALDAVCHLGAALDVLELHAQHHATAVSCVCRDLLRIYHAKADEAHAAEPQGRALLGLLYDMSLNLGNAIEVLDHLNGEGDEEPVLHAVSYLLKAARRFAQEGVSAGLP